MTFLELRAAVVDSYSEAFAYSYLDRSRFIEATQTLQPWSGMAAERWRTQATKFLEARKITLSERLEPGKWLDFPPNPRPA